MLLKLCAKIAVPPGDVTVGLLELAILTLLVGEICGCKAKSAEVAAAGVAGAFCIGVFGNGTEDPGSSLGFRMRKIFLSSAFHLRTGRLSLPTRDMEGC